MREIKFRAWDGEKMHGNIDVIDGSASVMENAPDDARRILLEEGGKSTVFYSDWAQDKQKDWPLMQFTGLKDKNGTEIYEGDIISEMWRCVVEYRGGCFMVRFSNSPKINKPEPLSVFLNRRDRAGTDDLVIGNIYANPELLEQGDQQ